MPNNQREDYVPTHRHTADDVSGLGALLFPPTQIAVGVAAAPTTNSTTFATLTNMSLPVNPPSIYGIRLWEVTLTFTAEVSVAAAPAANVGAQIRLAQAGTAVPNSTRRASNTGNGSDFPFQLITEATVVIAAGTSVTFTGEWATGQGTDVVTSTGTSRRLEATMRPYAGAAA